jgi:hypothetical protein
MFMKSVYVDHRRLLRGEQLIIMSGMEQMEGKQCV